VAAWPTAEPLLRILTFALITLASRIPANTGSPSCAVKGH
jgi:hypothetical protein